MSTGSRIPLARAIKASKLVSERLGLDKLGAVVVGSVRRMRQDVGDLDLLAPASPKKSDPVYDAIMPFCDNVAQPMFAADSPKFIRAVEGFKPGFLACKLLCNLRIFEHEDSTPVPLNVFRHTPENAGWAMLMRTGPDEFGKWFLYRWKLAYGIPEDHPASRDGHLIDANGVIVPVATEAECFKLARVDEIAPSWRDNYIAGVKNWSDT